eukprot:TRINITY_DN55980_c0_g1_i1.p1 TRINITY_DN55980_c0_g1~~TRINITY_DN55980_c0_g1_i1.p1  ORF type:complete len:326 (-),score=28.98 TRINITY_DN55980_c0_g1_i1:375-1352(-)
MARSRSPRRRSGTDSSEWISRALVMFGRYPAGRPSGLQVDESGSMLMADLMREWGDKQGLHEDDVLWAVKQNMQHPDGSMRFSISTDRRGQTAIKVLPRRGAEQSQRAPNQPSEKGSQSSLHTTAEKLTMSLEDLIPPRRRPDKSANSRETFSNPQDWHSNKSANHWKASATSKNWHSEKSANSWAASSKPWEWKSWRESTAQDRSYEVSGSGQSRGGSGSGRSSNGRQHEQIHRWIGWALKTGYRDLGLRLVGDGALRLDDLADAMRRDQPSFGDFDARELKRFLQETDQEGRFEVDSKWHLRKIPRGERTAWGWSSRDGRRSW